VKAETHTEVYRPFLGTIRPHPPRTLTLAWSGVRVGFRKKLPALILFTIPAITTVVISFLVQLKFDAEAGTVGSLAGAESKAQARAIGALLSNQLGAVEELILQLLRQIQPFVVLAMGWYGSGLIAEDKKLRANLLYFARPLTRWTYFLGKLGTVTFWGACAVIVPVNIVCGVATFSSPDWSFLTERWDTILKLESYAVLLVLVHGLLVLAISSLCDRRNHALAGLFGFYFLTSAGAEAMSELLDAGSWRLLSIPRNFERISVALFDTPAFWVDWPLEASLWSLGFLVLATVFVLSRQTKKMEVGA
jgi:ABC-type transport system involved in multi-copper enzyme maturation permease subunit